MAEYKNYAPMKSYCKFVRNFCVIVTYVFLRVFFKIAFSRKIFVCRISLQYFRRFIL